MQVSLLESFGGPEVLRPARVPVPVPGPGEVLIEAEAVGIGFAQTQQRADRFPAPFWRPQLPLVLGGDVVGHVAARGPGVVGTGLGDRVAAFVLEGAYADYVVAPAAGLVRVPPRLDAAEATVLAGTGPIAAGVLAAGGMRRGDRVLVLAAAGGVGHLAVQLARAAGAATVVGTAHGPAKGDFVRSLGADAVVDHGDPDWAAQVRDITGGGVDLVLDGVGGSTLPGDLHALRPGGRLVVFGAADGGPMPSVPVLSLMQLVSVTGFTLSAWRTGRPDEYRTAVARLTRGLLSGEVRSVVDTRLPLTEAAAGHARAEGRRHPGRITLHPFAGRPADGAHDVIDEAQEVLP